MNTHSDDDATIAALRDWLTPYQWETLCLVRDEILRGKAGFETVHLLISFSEMPYHAWHAFGRVFCPDAYEAWMNRKGSGA